MLAMLPVLLALVAAAGIFAVLRGTRNRSKMGINLHPPSACPKCGHKLPAIRRPKNIRQAMWGGWTCAGCGTELDKWGNERSS